MSLTENIKEYALDIGYAAVGFTAADAFADYRAELSARNDQYDFLMKRPAGPFAGAEPRTLMPGARSIVVVAYDFGCTAFPESLVGVIGRIYQARCYTPPPNRLHGARRELLASFLRQNGCAVGQGFMVPLRPAATRAGVATVGRNTFAYAARAGSFICLEAFVVDAELACDAPTERVNCPPNCRACIDACPTGALYEPLHMNPRRCITFNTCFARDGLGPGVSDSIPHDIREAMSTRVHGCDACQEACPRNRARLEAKLPEDPFLERHAREFSLNRMVNMDEAYFETTAQLLLYNYIREKKYHQRNAAIALGNLGDRAAVPDLRQALGDPEAVVREHAAWALGKIGGTEAKRALEGARGTEPVALVAAAIEEALARSA
ncbi:PBS lyase HEAT domain protein repeat-containing protein [Solidesulfovibrio carbinoliphilus subsp. oakridgensis]|uniref:PBS lyase HEAT domain protein repeat-containing protein n=1 Tax=Solidesulfovibrio carbinoliphilus subsp. oakridgensis TaxID=694327 RepID=G7QCM5_9BACT|nr:HEAT repeat domain-containing protein [Solidesulfovibrio carbinoliphilus]EHJ46181.1 PBS lyase HEAT domain protein repeat-containing protein [Solidesulfovibrio carbinoliphilus subsp. oakridgensis]